MWIKVLLLYGIQNALKLTYDICKFNFFRGDSPGPPIKWMRWDGVGYGKARGGCHGAEPDQVWEEIDASADCWRVMMMMLSRFVYGLALIVYIRQTTRCPSRPSFNVSTLRNSPRRTHCRN